jgi:hypothetical protein
MAASSIGRLAADWKYARVAGRVPVVGMPASRAR